ncbi:MAG: hypothetical protein A2516_01380 [Alphaproteobacteria bacterium RIFOXYD12_FULL_60_8]|nr:MAG: hypothetical protein A2516_01380 [Alphaproteobacteria bacterium RIFOXYD12_FULL_60_8]
MNPLGKIIGAGLVLLGMAYAIPAFAAADCALPPEAQLGEEVARDCKGCHVFDGEKPSRSTGPNLSRIYGAKAGTVDDFRRYSEGMKKTSEKDVVWDDDTLDAYIANPKGFLEKASGRPGVRHGMNFLMPDPDKRREVIAFLKALKTCND